MKKVIKWACMASLMLGLCVSCQEQIASTSMIQTQAEGCTSQLENFVIDQTNHYSLSQKSPLPKETAIKQFDQFATNLQDEIVAKKYPIFGNTSITLSLVWYNEIVKVTKLDLAQTTPTTALLTATITIEHQTGDSAAFINEYGKKLQAAGLVTEDNAYYLYVGEFKTYEEAKDHFKKMNQEGVLDVIKLNNLCKSLSGFDYTGKVTIDYLIMDGNEAPKGTANYSSMLTPKHTHIYYDNYETYNGCLNINIKK